VPQLRPKPDAIAPEIRRNCVGIQPQLHENQPQLRENQPQLRGSRRAIASEPRAICVGSAERARALCVRAQCIVRRCAVRCASVRRIAVARRELPVAGGRGRWQWTLRRPPVPFTCAIAKGPRWSRRWRHGERGRGRLRREARARGPRARAPRARAPRAAPKGEDGHPRRRAAGAAHQGRAAQARLREGEPRGRGARSRASANGVDARRALQRRAPAAAPARLWRAGPAVGSALLRATHCQQCVSPTCRLRVRRRLPPAARPPSYTCVMRGRCPLLARPGVLCCVSECVAPSFS
jgi:hypothetical protein